VLYEKAARLERTQCDGGNMESCCQLGEQYAAGWKGTPWDERQAAALFERACNGNSANGCQQLGDAYFYGIGVAKDEGKGAELLKKSCALGSKWGCTRAKSP
jgi:TPR repeat protein